MSVNSRAVIAGMLIAVGALALAIAMSARNSPNALNRSVEALLITRLDLRYHTKKQSLDAIATDQEGMWWVVFDTPLPPRAGTFEKAGLSRADAEDVTDYTRIIEAKLAPSISLKGYQLFRGEMPLGAKSICEELPCNIAVLAQPNGSNAIVIISKN